MRLVIVSDTHNQLSKFDIPDGDVLLHCGDFCGRGDMNELQRFHADLLSLPHKHKVVIAGNHDWPFEIANDAARAVLEGVTYLQDDGIVIEGVKIYGSPWQPAFMNWAFNLPRAGRELAQKWALIPDDTDILMTHGPPYGILDRTRTGRQVGCELLRKRVETIKPRLHCFGHIHEAYGEEQLNETLFVNASSVNLSYQPWNKPVVKDFPF